MRAKGTLDNLVNYLNNIAVWSPSPSCDDLTRDGLTIAGIFAASARFDGVGMTWPRSGFFRTPTAAAVAACRAPGAFSALAGKPPGRDQGVRAARHADLHIA